MVDDPDFVQVRRAQHDEVELRVIVDRVGVQPVRQGRARIRWCTSRVSVVVIDAAGVAGLAHLFLDLLLLRDLLRRHRRLAAVISIDVDELGVIRDRAVALQIRIEVLDQVIPGVPFPDDLRVVLAERLQLVDGVGPHALVRDGLRVAPVGDGVLAEAVLPGDSQEVAVRQGSDVVVEGLVVVRHDELPEEFAVPGEALELAAHPAAFEPGVVGDDRRAHEAAVLQEVG